MFNKKLHVRMLVLLTVSCLFIVALAAPCFAAKKIKLKMAGQSPVEHQSTLAMEKIAEEVKEASDGRIEIKVFPANQLGDYTLMYEELKKGTMDMALISVPSQFDQRLELTYVPWLAKDYNDARKIYAKGSWLFDKMEELHEGQGVKFLGFNLEGFGGLGLTKEAVEVLNPEVDKGVLLRVPPMDVFKFAVEDMGYSTVTVPYAELYTALQTGVAEGWTGGSPVHSYQGFRDVIKYYYQINEYIETESYLVSSKVWEQLSPEDQKIIADACERAAAHSIEISEKEDREYFEKLKEAGIEGYWFT
ncbi:MAG: TRAP transporter substrate-binding protein DctP, partial [Synergistales bacterium]|nr:TRAP transporter substrate-binding protein DctP [Synergistales bacterium]